MTQELHGVQCQVYLSDTTRPIYVIGTFTF